MNDTNVYTVQLENLAGTLIWHFGGFWINPANNYLPNHSSLHMHTHVHMHSKMHALFRQLAKFSGHMVHACILSYVPIMYM